MRPDIAVSRRTVGRSTLNNPSDTLRSTSTSGQVPFLQKAVVVEVYENPSTLTSEEKQTIAESVDNPEFVDVLPTNSILARIISNAADMGTPVSTILFPFFSSHIQFPIVPGEQVYVVYDDPTRNGTSVGYWLSRISERRTVEDVNYTVHDRKFFAEYNPQQLSTSERAREGSQQFTPNFPNGGETSQTNTLRVTGSNAENPYDGIVETSKAVRNFTFEPVPRYNKRACELVLQGKNNSTIVLGADRTGPAERAEVDSGAFAGAIDIVAGRGRKLPQSDSEEPEETAPRLITNTRSQREVNKTPYLNEGQTDNIREGDPDLVNDAARLLVTMQSEVDVNFQLKDLPFPESTLEFSQPNEGQDGTYNKSYVASQADHIRIIARKSDEVNGTILIVRKGDTEEELGYIFINEDGKMQLFSSEIYLGKATGKEEPYIKWSEYKKSIEKLQAQIDSLRDFCNDLTTNLFTAFTTAIATPYSPIAGLNSQAPSLQSNNLTLRANLQQPREDVRQAIEDAKSERIFGE